MGFLKKIFGGGGGKKKKNSSGAFDAEEPSPRGSNNGSSRKARRRQQEQQQTPQRRVSAGASQSSSNYSASGIKRSSRPPSSNVIDLDEDDEPVVTMQVQEPITSRSSISSRQSQEELRAAYESSQKALKGGSVTSPSSSTGYNDNYLDRNNSVSPAGSGSLSPRLTPHHLQQWERHHSQGNGHSPTMGGPAVPTSSSRPVYTMSSELPNQQMVAMDDMNRSDASSSSFNLSTDAEDSEYEMMKRRGVYPLGSNTLDTSTAVDTVTSYTTDEDRSKIFPNLPTDDEMTQATEPSLTRETQPPPSLLGLEPNEDEPGRMNMFPSSLGMADDLRAWSVGPHGHGHGTTGTHEPPTTRSSTSRDHHFFPGSEESSPTTNSPPKTLTMTGGTSSSLDVSNSSSNNLNNSMRKAAPVASITTSRNMPGAAPREFTTPREFASPKSQASHASSAARSPAGKRPARGGEFTSDFNADFGDFADFSNFPSSSPTGAWKEEKKEQRWEDTKDSMLPTSAKKASQWLKAQADPPAHNGSGSGTTAGFDDARFESAMVATSHVSNPTAGFQQDTSLSDLLEAAKSKRRGGGSRGKYSSKTSSGSVNSAPAITAAYLRQHHNLGRYSGGAYNSNGDTGTTDQNKSGGDGTSVSDIIESLEATNRMKKGNVAYSHRSVGDTGAFATAKAAKERLRERRRRERESVGGIHNSRSAELSDSDESDHEASESWLFDEVTGALGPRGIAADLESLSGRSNRSKNSHGGKSQKSSRRKSSRKSSSRRHRSDKSVDSHGSRTSRNSRYSHRSTKSFLSQMSEQSRSVANDLLRLEMQLAMVGSSQEKRDDNPARVGSSGASLGGTSRGASRSSARKSLNTSTASSSRGVGSSAASPTVVRRTKITVLAPPGKLGIILANKADSKGTVVSGVRTTSVLVDRISPGDRIVAIDGEDVSRMTVSEITTIMSRKAEYERTLTVLTIPKPLEGGTTPTSASANNENGLRSPTKGHLSVGSKDFDNSFSSNTFRR